MIRPSSSPSESRREQLLNDYHWLAVSLARRVAGRARGESIDDLTQVALLGLVRAIDRYDATRGVPFAAYASATITGELKHYLRDSSWMVRPSRRVQDLYLRVAEEQRELALELGRHPTPAEIARRVGATPDAVVEALQARELRRFTSLDSSIFGHQNRCLSGRLGSPDRGVDEVDDRLAMDQLLGKLPLRLQRMMRMRFVDRLTQVEIAEKLGLSQAHVQRLLLRTLNQLRQLAAAS